MKSNFSSFHMCLHNQQKMTSLRSKEIHFDKRLGYHVTVLLDNFVDKDIQSMLLPFNILQNMLFYPKYRIKDNFIYPNSIVSKLVSLCVMILSIILYFYLVYELHIDKDIRYYSNVTYVYSYPELCLYATGFAIYYSNNVLQTKMISKNSKDTQISL